MQTSTEERLQTLIEDMQEQAAALKYFAMCGDATAVEMANAQREAQQIDSWIKRLQNAMWSMG